MKQKGVDWRGYFEPYTITQQITDHLMHTIVFEAVNEGEKLPSESDLAEIFGVSRQTVRESLKALSSIGLLDTKAGRNGGHYVAKITSEHVLNSLHSALPNFELKEVPFNSIYEMRDLIDAKSSYLAAINRTEEDLMVIKDNIEFLKTKEMEDHIFFRSDYEVHRSIGAASKNKLLVISLDLLSRTLAPMFQGIPCTPELKKQLIDELEEVYIAIVNQDSKRAMESMKYHISHFQRFFKEKTPERFTS